MVSAKSTNVRSCARFRNSAFFTSALAILLYCAAMAKDSSKRSSGQTAPLLVAEGLRPNCHPVYQQLRNAGLSGESAVAQNVVLKRDAATLTFKTGNFYFISPVNAKVTGAVFIGAGTFSMVPPLESEKRNLSLLTNEKYINEEFEQLVLRFTDDTYEEIKKVNGTSVGSATGVSELKEINEALKKRIQYNLAGRLLNDVLSNQPGELFIAFIKGKKYSGKEIFAIDPNGVRGFEPEEVVFQTWDENKYGTWAAFHYSDEYKTGNATGTQRNSVIDIQHHMLNTQIEKNGKLRGDATTTFVPLVDELRVVPFDLFNTLRVQSVTGPAGESLDFIQEDKDEDPQFFAILPKPIPAGEKYSVRTIYSGKDAVSNEGAGNYFPLSRTNWYPNSRHGDYATYEMNFRVPKHLKMIATGAKMREVDGEDWTLTEWKSRTEQSVAGFNFGNFKSETKKLEGMEFEVESCANAGLPNALRGLETSMAISTTGMIQRALAEAELSIRLFSDYFGPTPFKRISMTQQAAFNFGQAWPELVYLPMSSFLDGTTRFGLLGFDAKGYFKIVGPHEVAHQWWGHAVGWSSYRDQWMSEGFAEMSASLFIQMIQKNPLEFIKFWNDEKEMLTEKNKEGFRAIDVGPVTLGYRSGNAKSGSDIPRKVLYAKGGYILHMLRMMMWNSAGDQRFKEMMRDFVKTYTNRPASTEDFKAMAEKHMPNELDLDGNKKLDWFFDPYVYGTTLPNYRFEHSIDKGPNGPVLTFKITQSNVGDNFKMLVPVYLELGNGKVVRLGSATLTGNATIKDSVSLGSLNDRPKRAFLNYYNDVLAIMTK